MLANVFRAAVICFLSMTIVSTSSLARDNRRRVKRSLHGRVFAGLFATSGRRGAMEDENVISTTDDASIAAVFDGHGGGEVSSTLKRNFMKYLANQEGIKSGGSDQTLANAVLRALKSIDADVSKVPELSRQGSTAAVLLVNTYRALQTDGANTNHPSLIAVNVGDSRIVLCRAGRAVDLSIDHKPNTTSERARIEGVGGLVVWTGLSDPESGEHLIGTGVYRVNGVLALSRAIGTTDIGFSMHCILHMVLRRLC